MITPIKRTFERQISSASLEFSCEEEQKFQSFIFHKIGPTFIKFSAVLSEVQ